MIFIETTIFTKLIGSYLTDDEYLGLQGFLLKYPEAGKLSEVRAVCGICGGPCRAREKVGGSE